MKAQKQKKPQQQQQPSMRSDSPAQELSVESFWKSYTASSTPRTRLIDLFIVYLLIIIKCQLFYRIVVGDDFPRNAFVSGLFCPLGVIVLLVVLRGGGLNFRQFAEFFLAVTVLFVVAINFAG